MNELALLSDQELFERYKWNCGRAARAVSGLSLGTRFESPSAERFFRLSPERRFALVEKLALINEILESSVRLLGFHQGHFFLRAALKKFGWRIDDSALACVQDGDTFEIYGTDLRLKVANLRFLEVCTYTLEELLGHEFYELFSRDPAITRQIIDATDRILRKESRISFDLGPNHEVTETFSGTKRAFWVESRLMAPVYSRSNVIEGFLYSATVKVLPRS